MSKSKSKLIAIVIVVLIGLLGISRAVHIGPRIRLGYQPAEQEPDRKLPVFNPETPKIDGCYITATGKEQGPALARKINSILLNEGTYTNEQLHCITEPGVVFRVWKGSQSLDVVLCVHCGEMYTATNEADGRRTPGVYTLMAGDSRAQFARLAKETFPSNPDIQAL